MLNLSDIEEILAILIAVAIIMGFVFSTYKEIQITISEEKTKQREKKEIEVKVETLINYFDAKKKLIDAVNKVTKKGVNTKKWKA